MSALRWISIAIKAIIIGFGVLILWARLSVRRKRHRLARSSDPEVRHRAAVELGMCRDVHSIPLLVQALEDSDLGVRIAASNALQKIPEWKDDTPLPPITFDQSSDTTNWNIETSALHAAAEEGYLRAVNRLIRDGARIDQVDESGNTPLLQAVRSGHYDIVQALLTAGAAVDARDKDGETSLFSAAVEGDRTMAEILISKGADVNARNNNGETPLFCAAHNQEDKMIEYLISEGAALNGRTVRGDTALHEAVMEDHLSTVSILISHGIDVNIQNDDGQTALHLAARFGRLDILRLLLRAGVKLNLTDEEGLTEYEWAKKKGHSDIIALLKESGVTIRIKFRCPSPTCGKNLTVNESMIGKKAKCPFCSTVLIVPQPQKPHQMNPYGLSVNNPVLCGGGPPGEQAYLYRLRCPAGSRVHYKRGGSSIATDLSFLNRHNVKFYPGKANMGATDEFVRKSLNIDGYEVECECGKHHMVHIWMDMYHQGPDQPIDIIGWSLAVPLRDHLLKAASIAGCVESPQQAEVAVKQIQDILAQEPKLAKSMGMLQNLLARGNDAQLVALCKMLSLRFREWAERLTN